MCGDGTNDMGALRQSNVGVAMLNVSSMTESIDKTKKMEIPKFPIKKRNQEKVKNTNIVKPKTFKEAMEAISKEQMENSTIVKLGDASIAAPFTSKVGKLTSVCDIINQGRCTLVTTLQMFRILAINSLVTAYSQSVHYSHGIRMGDYQSTIHALIITFSFFFVSNTQVLNLCYLKYK